MKSRVNKGPTSLFNNADLNGALSFRSRDRLGCLELPKCFEAKRIAPGIINSFDVHV